MEKMISPARALELVLERCPAPKTETVEAVAALGRVLAEDLRTPEDVPPFDRAMMDGYAARAADAGRQVDVVALVAAGHVGSSPVEPGRVVEIMTGAPCPEGTEAVVPVEDTRREGDRVTLPDRMTPGKHIQPRGSIRPSGSPTARAGDQVNALVLANLAAFGRTTVEVWARPTVAVVTTGDELIGPGADRSGGAIRDSNGPMLDAMARACGAAGVTRHRAADTEASLTEALDAAAEADVIVLTGGVSMGRYDLVPAAAAAAGFTPVFHKVVQKPGKPLFFATSGSRLLFGLPGNPRSSHFCFHRYVCAALRAAVGRSPHAVGGVGALTAPLQTTTRRPLWLPVRATLDRSGGARLEPFDEHGSADVFSTTRANGYARLAPGAHDLVAGATLPFEWTCDAFIS